MDELATATATALSQDQAILLLRNLTPEQRSALEDQILSDPAKALWSPSPGPQSLAYHSEAQELFYGGSAGGGKALDDREPVVTPFGFRPIGGMKVGDKVLASDGTMSCIIGVYPQGVQPIFSVEFADGATLRATGDHLWNYSIARKGKWKKSGREWKVATTDMLRTFMESGRRVLIPLCEPLKFNKSYRYNQRPVDPYMLGVFLGDGCVTSKVSFTSADPEIAAVFESLHPGDWRFDGRFGYTARGEGLIWWREALQYLKVYGKGALDKSVPESYLWGKVDDRIALLQGLMDTDGTCTPDGKAYFTSISKQLADDVRFLVLSLGGRATITTKEPFYRDRDGTKIQGQDAYTCYIRMPDNRILFRLERKKVLAGDYNGGGKILKRRIVAISLVDFAPATCIKIDHPSSLFVAGEDLIVTHNSALITGLALTQHQRSLILRRESTQLRGMVDDIAKTLGTRNGLSTQAGQWRIPTDKALFQNQLVEFGGVPDPGSEEKHQGVAHDFLAFDEVTQLSEYVVDYLSSWNRSTTPGQRCRMLLTSNPPTPSTMTTSRGQATGGGLWLVRRYAPWLDPQYRDPHKLGTAAPGELRYYVTLDGQEQEWADPLPFLHPCRAGTGPIALQHLYPERDHEMVVPRSRTFIPARVSDNPYLANTDYESTLQKLPEPLRSAMLYGDFSVSLSDRPKQLIPTEWYRAATARWEASRSAHPHPRSRPMTAIAVDVSRSAHGDKTVVFRRHGDWFDEPIVIPSQQTLNGASVASRTVEHRRDNCPLVVDANGTGASVFDHLRNNTTIADSSQLIGYVGSKSSTRRDRSGLLGFVNKRTESYWALRDALDPATSTQLALPPHDDLMQELLVLTWSEQSGKIKLMTKEDVGKTLGRSPDYSDALAMAWSVYDEDSERATSAESARAARLTDVEPTLNRRRHNGRRPSWSDRSFDYPR